MISFYYSRSETRDAFEHTCQSLIKFEGVRPADLPKDADYVLSRLQLDATLERFASRRGAMPVVVPEGGPWLVGKMLTAIKADSDLVIVGYDVARP